MASGVRASCRVALLDSGSFWQVSAALRGGASVCCGTKASPVQARWTINDVLTRTRLCCTDCSPQRAFRHHDDRSRHNRTSATALGPALANACPEAAGKVAAMKLAASSTEVCTFIVTAGWHLLS